MRWWSLTPSSLYASIAFHAVGKLLPSNEIPHGIRNSRCFHSILRGRGAQLDLLFHLAGAEPMFP